SKRIARWPLLNILHVLFAAIGGFLRRNAEATARPLLLNIGAALVDQQFGAFASPTAGGAAGHSLGERIQTTFALLQQSYPAASALYRQRRLWESLPAATAAGEL